MLSFLIKKLDIEVFRLQIYFWQFTFSKEIPYYDLQ